MMKKKKKQTDEERVQGILDDLNGTTTGRTTMDQDDADTDKQDEMNASTNDVDDGEWESMQSKEELPEGDVDSEQESLDFNDQLNADKSEEHDYHDLDGEDPELTKKKMKIGLFNKHNTPALHIMIGSMKNKGG